MAPAILEGSNLLEDKQVQMPRVATNGSVFADKTFKIFESVRKVQSFQVKKQFYYPQQVK